MASTPNATLTLVRSIGASRQEKSQALSHAKSHAKMTQDAKASHTTRAGGAATSARRARKSCGRGAGLFLCEYY